MASQQTFNEDQPLGDNFNQNPYQYVQTFVRNMNNQMFLSQYQLNNLYALLLIGRSSPWDQIKPYDAAYKQKIDEIVNKKVEQVKYLLNNLSQVYEEKVKKTTFNQIQRLMGIIRAKNKSIFIQKNFSNDQNQQQNNIQKQNNKAMIQNNQKSTATDFHKPEKHTQNQKQSHSQNKQASQQKQENIQNQQSQCLHHQKNQHNDLEVFNIFAGLANLPNLSAMALSNCLQYNSTQRFIKFKMSKNYIMTIRNQDPICYDLTSQVSRVPSAIMINHVFPFLTAQQLFRVRSVCKQWLNNVKQAWHATFKRQMYIQLLAGQFCKDIQFYYKCIQLRNPFFQKLSLLLHALIQIIEWDSIIDMVQNNSLNIALKRVLMILMKFLGILNTLPNHPLAFNSINQLSQELFEINKQKVYILKTTLLQFFNSLKGCEMSINQLRSLKVNYLDHPLMRADELQTEQKTPLLLLLFIKQLNLQQILKNHLYFSQQYLLNSKNRLDDISRKMPQQKGFLEGVYKVLLLKSGSNFGNEKAQDDEESSQMPNFQQMIASVFQNKETGKADFTIKTKNSKTSIFMDKATKFDIIISTVKKLQPQTEIDHNQSRQQKEQIQQYKQKIDENKQREQQGIQKRQKQSQNKFQENIQ